MYSGWLFHIYKFIIRKWHFNCNLNLYLQDMKKILLSALALLPLLTNAQKVWDYDDFTVTKVSNPTHGEREADGLIAGGDRQNSYTWRLAGRGDEIYIATARNIGSVLVNLYGSQISAASGISMDAFRAMMDAVTNGDILRNDVCEGADIICYNRTTGEFKVVWTGEQSEFQRMAVTFGDNVYFVGSQEVIYDKLERVLLIGAGRAGRMLAQMLEKQGVFVKVIEKDKERCRILSEQLNNGLVLCGDGTDIDLLTEEGITEADCVVCLTDDDKLNLLLALLAKHLGAKKTIVRVARNEYVDLMAKVGVDIALSARLLSAAEVMRFVRQGGIVSVALLEGAKAEALELQVQPGCKVDGKTLIRAKLPRECLVCGIVHDGEASVPNGQSMLNAGDRVIVFAQTEVVQDVMDMFAGNRTL